MIGSQTLVWMSRLMSLTMLLNTQEVLASILSLPSTTAMLLPAMNSVNTIFSSIGL